MVIQERDRVIRELEEKVAFLEAEVSTAGILDKYCSNVISVKREETVNKDGSFH